MGSGGKACVGEFFGWTRDREVVVAGWAWRLRGWAVDAGFVAANVVGCLLRLRSREYFFFRLLIISRAVAYLGVEAEGSFCALCRLAVVIKRARAEGRGETDVMGSQTAGVSGTAEGAGKEAGSVAKARGRAQDR